MDEKLLSIIYTVYDMNELIESLLYSPVFGLFFVCLFVFFVSLLLLSLF